MYILHIWCRLAQW